ncbi:MAG: hypothetical protein ACFFFH_17240, partial [Candidatus Thorarchaeota archaeon]
KSNNSENLVTFNECELIPLFQKQRGWEGWRPVNDQDNNKLAFLTYWYSKEDTIKVTESGLLKDQLRKIYLLMDQSSK